MKKSELEKVCSSLKRGDKIQVNYKTIYMSKYGNKSNYVPRKVSYAPLITTFDKYQQGYICYGTGGGDYFSKIDSIIID